MRSTTMSQEWTGLPTSVRAMIERHQTSAPVRLSALASELGIPVKSASLPVGISGEIRPSSETRSGFVIRVNRHDAEARQRFTVAHELAHFLLHRDAIAGGVSDDVLFRSALSNTREAQANRLAADILMPDRLVNKTISNAKALEVEDIPDFMAREFAVSEAAIKIRLGIV